MLRSQLPELQFITPMKNVPSMCEHGILSNVLVRKVVKDGYISVADEAVQAIRATKQVPGGRILHEYANLYICARNPMMYVRKGLRDTLCVLRVSTDVLDLPEVVVSDGNAASGYTLFAAAPGGLAIVDRDLTFAEWWTHPNYFEWRRRTRLKCAEVLVPDVVHPRYIMGAWVVDAAARQEFDALGTSLTAAIDAHLFFA